VVGARDCPDYVDATRRVVTGYQPEHLGGCGDLKHPQNRPAASGQAHGGAYRGGAPVRVEQEVQPADVDEGRCS
jgi:hypothetical protein